MTRRTPAQYDFDDLLFDQTILTKHFTSPRRKKIAFVVAHHMTIVGKGDGKANDACYKVWQSRPASAHYGVDGEYIRQFVWDGNAAWSTADATGNHAGISIEHANSTAGPKWQVSETTWKNGAKLAAYLHIAYKLGRPTSAENGKKGTLRKHSSFTSTACPGPFMDAIWGKYVAHAQDVYDAATSKTPAPPKPKQVRWYEHRHLNTWGDDGADGTRTFKARLPVMVKDLTKDKPEVITLNEVRDTQQASWRDALDEAGYTVAIAKQGNLIAVIDGTTVGKTTSQYLPDKVQGGGRKESVTLAHVRVNGVWAVIVASHLDYRDGAKYNSIRVAQAKAVISATKKFALLRGVTYWRERSSIGLDENSVSWVRDYAFKPNKLYPAVKAGIDAIYSRRKARANKVIRTRSDHPIVAATYGRNV